MRYIFTLVCLFCWTHCFSTSIPDQDKVILKEFLNILVKESEAGYVLHGKKPICIHGFNVVDRFLIENEHHKRSVCLKEGARVWKKYSSKYSSIRSDSNILVHIYDNEDPLVGNCVHILVVNRDLFIKTVNDNLSLFQYVLGPDVTAAALFEKLTDPSQSFHGFLKNDKVLIGILLGFGTQNSLYVSRLENLTDACLDRDIAPYKSLASQSIQKNPVLKDWVLLTTSFEHSSKDMKPSFGHISISDEIADLYGKIEISSKKLACDSPIFMFGRTKTDKDNDSFILDLEKTQALIAEKLKSPIFLKEILAAFFPNEMFSINKELKEQNFLSFENEVKSQLKNIVATGLFENLKNGNEDYIDAFILGMQNADRYEVYDKPCPKTLDYSLNQVLLEAQKNIELSEKKIDQIHQDTQFVSLVPFKLYYRTIEQGDGERLDNQTQAVLHYTIIANENDLLCDTRTSGIPKEIDLSQTIPGFAHGVRGMRVGETREIIIHPSLGYGLYTTLEKGAHLKAIVQLVEIGEGPSGQLPDLLAIDFSKDIKPDLEKIVKVQSEEVGYYLGYHAWDHYKHGNDNYNLDQILGIIQKLRDKEIIQIPSSIDDQAALNRLHWNIYQLQPKEIRSKFS